MISGAMTDHKRRSLAKEVVEARGKTEIDEQPSMLKLRPFENGVTEGACVRQSLIAEVGGKGSGPQGSPEDTYAIRGTRPSTSPNTVTQCTHTSRLDPRPVPADGLAHVRLNTTSLPYDTDGQIINLPGAAWAADQIQIIQIGNDQLALSQSRLDVTKGRSKTEREEGGHEGIALLAAFSLEDVVHAAIVTLPEVSALLPIGQPEVGQKAMGTRQVGDGLKHRSAIHMIKSADAINLRNSGLGIQISERAQEMDRGIHTTA